MKRGEQGGRARKVGRKEKKKRKKRKKTKKTKKRTVRPLLADPVLQRHVQRLGRHLPGEKQRQLGLARGPQQHSVRDTQALRHERQPGARVADGVVWVLVAREK